ncbi:unnamed protein product [Oreochromis niloticus]|nr:unnamed protein product [Mustela putorius furo]
MGHSLLCLLGLFLLSTVIHGNTGELGVKATLTADRLTIPAGGSVTLTCDVKHSADFEYEWLREPRFNSEKTTVAGESKRELVTSEGGIYSCRGRIKGTNLLIKESDSVIIQETASKPRATLTAQSSILPAGGSVTLSCSVEGSAGWKFDWFRRDSEFSGAQKIVAGTSEHTISISEGGIYYCRGGRGDPVFSTEDSAPVTIQRQVLAAVKLQHSWSQIFTGETITLRCEIQGGEGKVWKYEWTVPNTNSPPTSSEYRISRVSVSHSGDYRCRGSSDYLLTGWSDAFTLTVSSSKPRATLTAQSSVIPAGGSVTLSCSVEGSAGWKFDWFRRDSVSSKAQLMRGNETNRVISVSQGGLYHCRGGRGDPVYYTEDSSDVTVVETFPSKPTVTLQPSWTQIYSGETVTVRCEIQGGEGAQWTYEWRAAKLNTPPTSNEYRIIRATESDSGGYSCRGRRDYFFSEWSDIITLTVSYKPKAKLRADNTAVPVGGSVTLTCSVNPSSSSGWKYYWYRDEKSSEALTTQDAVFHSNGQISVSQEGLYRCRGGRGNPVYYTEDSQSVRIGKTVTASNRPVVTLYPNWSEIYRGETITVRCEIHGGDTEWDYEWETNSMIKAPNQNEYRIRSASSSNSGNYRCKGRMKSSQHKTTEWSDSVTLTVSDNKPRPVLTVSPSWLSPGASVTLNCEVEHPSAGWSFYWYKAVPDLSEKSSSYELLPDGSGTAQDSYIIHGQTHTAGYVCRAGRGDPEYHTDHSQPKFVWSADVHSAASLTVSPDRVQHFTSDSVSLTCEGNFTEWRVRKFSEDGRLYSDCRRMTGSTCNINTSKSDTAVYWCESGSGEFSSAVNITVQKLGVKATLTADRLTIPAGGSVTLTCDVKHSAHFEYGWYREPHLHSNQKTTVADESNRVLVTSEGGIYNCRGRIKGTNSVTEESDSVIIQETGHGVNITVTANSTIIPAGGSVTLSCDVKHSADLKYEWVRETSSAVKSTEAVGSDKVIRISKGGKYQCRGWRTDITSLIAQSDPVTIQETVSNRVNVTLQHSWSQIFTGETITLRCEIQGGEGKVWKYEWTAPNTNSPPTSSEYRISRVSVSHSGDYRCRGSSDYLLTGWSDAFTLTVSYKPKAKLRADNTTVPVGGSVTLTCSVSPSSSSGWKYYWYRDDTTVDAVSTSNGQISVSQEGLYRCRGGRGNPVYYTKFSQEVHINTTGEFGFSNYVE